MNSKNTQKELSKNEIFNLINSIKKDEIIKSKTFYSSENSEIILNQKKIIKELIFSNLTFSEDFELKNFENEKLVLTFKNCTFQKSLIFEKSKLKRIHITENNTIKEEFKIWNKCVIDKIRINKGLKVKLFQIFKKNEINIFSIQGIDKQNIKINKFLINKNKFLTKFEINACNIKDLEISENKYTCKVRISSNDEDSKRPQFNIFDKFLFQGNILHTYTRIAYIKSNDFKISNLRVLEKREMSIGNISINENGNFHIKALRNQGYVKIYKVNESELFTTNKCNNIQIDNSSLGSFEMQNFDFKSFKTVTMYDNTFKQLNTINVRWMSYINMEGKYSSINDEYKRHYDLKETYRQLKIQLENQKDMVQSQFFLSKEMIEYKKYIHEQRKFLFKDRNIFYRMYMFFRFKTIDRLILLYNENTNKFGSNWIKPILLLIVVNLIFYSSFAYYNFNFTGSILDQLKLHMGYYADFLIPTNTLKRIFVDTSGINHIWNFWNVTKTIIISALAYQSIYAFRKFTRR
jgi:hypothetical protein